MSVGGAKAPPSAWPGKAAVDDARTMLTRPSKPCQNNNYDNENWDLIIRVGDEFVASSGIRYVSVGTPQQHTQHNMQVPSVRLAWPRHVWAGGQVLV